MGVIFFYDNQWDEASALTGSSNHANFPESNTQLRDFNEPWRTNYGAGSGWGTFVIVANINNKLDFDEGGGELNATITAGSYTADELAAEIETQLEATGAHSYTVTYEETGADANKFKIVDDTGNVAFPWKTGTNGSDNTGYTIGETIGFDETADDASAASHTADDTRYCTTAWLKVDLGAATGILAFFVRNHNVASGDTKKIQADTVDSFATPAINQDLTRDADWLGYIWSSNESYRWWRFIVYPDYTGTLVSYYESGRIFLGPGFEPTRNYAIKSKIGRDEDQSIIKKSLGGQISTIQLDDYKTWQYVFKITDSSDLAAFKTMLETVKKSIPLWICEDSTNFPDDTYYCQFIDWEWIPIDEYNDWWELRLQVEELV